MAEGSSAREEPAAEPEQIEAEIERTRVQLGDTVAEVADRADVKKQARLKVHETKTAAQAKASDTAAAARRTVQDAPRRAGEAGERVRVLARQNPAVAVGGASAVVLALLVILRARRR